MRKISDIYNVSRETFSKLEVYHSSLLEWQNKFNLVSKNSLDDAWNRHFVDSIQLVEYIPDDAKSLIDMGSGAGFPGMVLAILLNERTPYLKVTLVESITKKTLYLNHVKETASVKVEIINGRVEQIKNRKFDVVTSRAMTSLIDLLDYAYPFLNKKGGCVFPKGKSWNEEVNIAKNKWNFNFEVFDSKTSEEGKIILIHNLVLRGTK
ncbi:MAG: 16S rRNA (guanine(527)-N(7))-methyltransferase RsmG [Alphaproteobacteria bacterium]|nr:16S rRNA (guanine(527)-N(7))-methyltransferase RsmG [Alphaproteobacteria bacterium]